MWSLSIDGIGVSESLVSGVSVSFEADNLCGEITVDLADRSFLEGLAVPRAPREPVITYRHSPSHPAIRFYLEHIHRPHSPDARPATVWGRSGSARLASPWAQIISRQWTAPTTISAIVEELAALCGVAVSVARDYPVCQYCYAVSGQTPAEIIRDLATRSGQIFWPHTDGSLLIAPRACRNLPPPAVILDDLAARVESVESSSPDFGNRVLISGDAAVAGLSVQVVPIYPDDDCVPADGEATVRLVAVVLGLDGGPAATGTAVDWKASGGTLKEHSSQTGVAMITGEVQRADSYRAVTLNLPAASVVGVYDYIDQRRRVNLFELLGGSVQGRVITFASSLRYYDQALLIDYDVAGAVNEWTAGFVPGDVTVTAGVAGAQGMTVIHQSNPSACGSQIALECVPADVCIGSSAAILAKVGMFGGPGRGPATFTLSGCGSLSSSRKTLSRNGISETLRTTTWGGASQVRLSADPVDGTISIFQPAEPGTELYSGHQGRVVTLAALLSAGTPVAARYTGDGTAMVSWMPAGKVTGEMLVREERLSEDDGTASFVVLSSAPASARSAPVLMITEYMYYEWGTDLYAGHEGSKVTLNRRLEAGTTLRCSYWVDQPLQPDCTATITVHVEDGSQDGGTESFTVRARDCRTQTTDPARAADETSEYDPPEWPEQMTLPDEQGQCDEETILARTPALTGMNWEGVSGVETAADCPGQCSCDQICTALRSSGRLAKAGYFWSQCMSACTEARRRKCAPCSVKGPAVLKAGATGRWDDGKGNAGEYSGALALLGQSVNGGYMLRMPAGGQGPFTLSFCYDRTEDSCCRAVVDFPPCTLSGPTSLPPGGEGLYSCPECTGFELVVVSGGMEERGRTAGGVRMALLDGVTSGWVSAWLGGRSCGTVHVSLSRECRWAGAQPGLIQDPWCSWDNVLSVTGAPAPGVWLGVEVGHMEFSPEQWWAAASDEGPYGGVHQFECLDCDTDEWYWATSFYGIPLY